MLLWELVCPPRKTLRGSQKVNSRATDETPVRGSPVESLRLSQVFVEVDTVYQLLARGRYTKVRHHAKLQGGKYIHMVAP